MSDETPKIEITLLLNGNPYTLEHVEKRYIPDEINFSGHPVMVYIAVRMLKEDPDHYLSQLRKALEESMAVNEEPK